MSVYTIILTNIIIIYAKLFWTEKSKEELEFQERFIINMNEIPLYFWKVQSHGCVSSECCRRCFSGSDIFKCEHVTQMSIVFISWWHPHQWLCNCNKKFQASIIWNNYTGSVISLCLLYTSLRMWYAQCGRKKVWLGKLNKIGLSS